MNIVNYITRFIEKQMIDDLFKGKVIVLYGPRQAGKTTLVKQILSTLDYPSVYLNCDEPDIRAKLAGKTSTELRQLIGNTKTLVIDEAQRVENIGLTLKLMVDTYPDIQIIATGSSSFELSNSISEPLTGRTYQYSLYPISELEIVNEIGKIETRRTVDTRLRYGNYPEVYTQTDQNEKERYLSALKSDYLLKDVLKHENIKGSDTLYKLLQLLALQIGKEVSLNELASNLEIDKNTVKRYIRILERGFVIFRLGAFSRSLRKEISKKDKIYFYDIGVRNALINNYNSVDIRLDKGDIWENYVIAERLKFNLYTRNYNNQYFWRTYNQQEIDLIEEKGGILSAYEIKWSGSKFKKPLSFLEAYTNSKISLINKDNYLDFVS